MAKGPGAGVLLHLPSAFHSFIPGAFSHPIASIPFSRVLGLGEDQDFSPNVCQLYIFPIGECVVIEGIEIHRVDTVEVAEGSHYSIRDFDDILFLELVCV